MCVRVAILSQQHYRVRGWKTDLSDLNLLSQHLPPSRGNRSLRRDSNFAQQSR